MVTQNDVAREVGVSRSMVSYVINGNSKRRVAPATKKKILDTIEKLGYRPNKVAQMLQQGKISFAQDKIGVVLCSADVFLRPYYTEILSGIFETAHSYGLQIGFIRFFGELKDTVLFNQLIHEEEIGSLILVSIDQCLKTDEDKNIIERIKERMSKIVCIEFQYNGLSSVMFDRSETAKEACEYLIKKGFTNIGYIGHSDERVEGVQRPLASFGLDSRPESFFLAAAFDMKGGFEATEKLIKEKKLRRAIITGSDEVAIGVISALSKVGLSVPDDVAIISIDNIESSSFTCPSLTTMNVPKWAMGERAVRIIADGLAGKDETAVNIMLISELVVRESC